MRIKAEIDGKMQECRVEEVHPDGSVRVGYAVYYRGLFGGYEYTSVIYDNKDGIYKKISAK